MKGCKNRDRGDLIWLQTCQDALNISWIYHPTSTKFIWDQKFIWISVCVTKCCEYNVQAWSELPTTSHGLHQSTTHPHTETGKETRRKDSLPSNMVKKINQHMQLWPKLQKRNCRHLMLFNYSHIVISQLWDVPPLFWLSPFMLLPSLPSHPLRLALHDAGLARAPQTHTEAGNYTG